MDQLLTIRAFVTVAEAASFTSAAERLNMSRAMASKHVMDLEAHLGLRLLNRTTRKVSLTEAGASYLERCREILDALEEADREVTSQAVEPVGRLRVSAPMTFGTMYLAPLIDAYAARFPRVSIDLVLNDRYVDLVEEGYDVAIRIGRLADSSLIARRIGSSRVVVCAAPAYLEANGVPRQPSDLLDHECLQYAYAIAGNAWVFDGPSGRETVRAKGRITCNNGEALCRMAISGLGVVREPDFILSPHLRSGALSQILADYSGDVVGIYAVHPSRRHVPLKLTTFVDFLSTAFDRLPPWSV